MSDRLDEIYTKLGEMSAHIEHTNELTEKNYKRTCELFDRTNALSQDVRDLQKVCDQPPQHGEDHQFVTELHKKMQARTAFWQGMQKKVLEKGILAVIGFTLLAFGAGAWQMFKDKL